MRYTAATIRMILLECSSTFMYKAPTHSKRDEMQNTSIPKMHLLAIALPLLTTVHAHGYLKSISVNGGASYLAWQVGQDDYLSPEPVRYARRIKV
jgi:hypothetical protein